MRIIQLISEDKTSKNKKQPKPEKEKLYHCDDRDEE